MAIFDSSLEQLIMKKLTLITFTLLICFSCKEITQESSTDIKDKDDWALLNFVKVDSINPILKPTPSLSFDCPLNKKEVYGKNVTYLTLRLL